MKRLREFLRYVGTVVAVLAVLGFGLRSIWAARPPDKLQLVVWGLRSGDETKGTDAQIREFERRFPNIRVINLAMGAGSGMNAQKLLTSIAGNTPPDLVRQDRFTIGDWASREAFTPLDGYLRDARQNPPSDPWYINPKNYYEACWKEAVYQGRVYAIPDSTDDRLLYYNKDLFRKAGLDPNRPPRTWDELIQYTDRLTQRGDHGSFKTIGFIPVVPTWTNSWFYLYSWQNGGDFMSPDGRRCTLVSPENREALQWCTDFYDRMSGAENVMAFASTFQPREMDPFIIGKMAMRIDTNVWVENLARYARDLDFGVAPPPVPAARLRGDGRFHGQPPFITWSGGFSYGIPAGCRHPKEAWLFIRWMNSLESRRIYSRAQQAFNLSQGRPYVPDMHADRRINEVIFSEFEPKGSDPVSRRTRAAMRVGLQMMPYARFRPVTFVGQRLWDEHVRLFESAIRRKQTAEEALAGAQAIVQRELNAVFDREKNPYLNLPVTVAVCSLALLALLGAFVFYCFRGGRVAPLLRSEARAGYMFALPWILGFLAFFLGPMIAAVVLSFCDYDVLHPPRWVGLENYANTFADPILGSSYLNILILAGVSIPLSIGISLGLAMLLNNKIRGMAGFRTLFYVPSLTPAVAIALLWMYILNPDSGPINQAWRATLTPAFGWPAPTWMASELWAKPAITLMTLWSAGGGIILWLAGLQGVPQHLYEAADLDGATALARFRHVTLPMLTPYILFNVVMGTITWLQRFTDLYFMTDGKGQPADSTWVPVIYIFNNAFEYFKMGYASAWAWIMFFVVMALTAVNLYGSKRWVHYDGERK